MKLLTRVETEKIDGGAVPIVIAAIKFGGTLVGVAVGTATSYYVYKAMKK